MHLGGVPDAGVDPAQRRHQRPVLAGWHRRHPAAARVGRRGDRDAGAGMLRVPGHRVVGVGVEPGMNLVAQGVVRALPRVVLVQGVGDHAPLDGMQLHPARHHVGPGMQGCKVGGQPIRVHQPVRVGGQQHAFRSRQGGGGLHGEPARDAGIGLLGRQRALDDMEARAGVQRHRPRSVRRAVRAVIDEEQDMVEARATLGIQRLQAWDDPVGFVTGRNGGDGRRAAVHARMTCYSFVSCVSLGQKIERPRPVLPRPFHCRTVTPSDERCLRPAHRQDGHPGHGGGLSDLTMRHWITSFR